jgi:hypothetical protein
MRQFFCLCLFVCLLASVPLRAQEAPTPTPDPKQPLKMALASPFALVPKPLKVQGRWGHWVPIQVTLSNTGEPVSGRLTLRLIAGNDSTLHGSETYTDIDLPTTSKKQAWLFARVDRSFSGGEVRFAGRNIKTLTGRFDMEERNPGTRLVLSVSSDGEMLSGLRGVKAPETLGIKSEIDAERRRDSMGYAPNQKTTWKFPYDLVRSLGVSHKNLPPRWVGLQIADAVILQDFPHAELSAAQLEALRGYVASGGALIILGGANWDRLAKSPLADLWPVMPSGAAPAAAAQREAFVRRYIERNAVVLKGRELQDALTGAPLMVTQAALRPGARAVWGSSSPMMAVKQFGAGQVVFLAGDPNQPPFAGWRGVPFLWDEVFAQTPRPAAIAETNALLVNYFNGMSPNFNGAYNPNTGYNDPQTMGDPSQALLNEIKTVKQLKTPPVSTIAWFLALYVFFLVPVNYCVLRLFDKRELAWITVPVIVVAFSVMSYAAARRIKGDTLLARQVNIVQGSGTVNGAPVGEIQARSDTMLWLFSPRKTAYAISGDNPRLVASDYVHNEEAAQDPPTIALAGDDKAVRVENARINMWTWRAFVGHATVPVKGGIQLAVQGGKPQVKNSTPFDMRGVVLKWNGRLYACGDVKAGATATPTVSERSDATGVQLASPIRGLSSLDRIFSASAGNANVSQVADKALALTLEGAIGDADALLIGWSNRAASPMTIEDASPASENVTLFAYRLE